jgi:hypothetical protein
LEYARVLATITVPMLDSSSTTLNKPEYGRKLLFYVENFQVLIERKFWREEEFEI